MLKKERAAFILETLHKLYPETPVPLDNKDNYTLLIAVLLSAQCTDESCLLYTSPSPRDGLLSRMPSSA